VVAHTTSKIDLPGTSEAEWQPWLTARRFAPADLTSCRSAVIVAAHPDDEVLGAGGTIATLAAAGARIRVIAVTDGEASHPGTDSAELARRRADESTSALHVLCGRSAEVIRLGIPDTKVADAEAALADQLLDLCAGFAVCLAPWEQDAHSDHEAAGRAARRARADVLTFPIWMWHWAAPDDPAVPWQRAVSVRLTAAAATAKRTAISAFTSQLTARSATVGPVLPAEIIAHFTRTQEVLFQ
jgi:LmbE family N-acetylglucosaminyl deacetylase